MLSLHRVHCIAVMTRDEDHANKSVVSGIVSDLDLIRTGIEARAGDVAQHPVISVQRGTLLRDAAQTMARHGVSHLVVVDPARLLPLESLRCWTWSI